MYKFKLFIKRIIFCKKVLKKYYEYGLIRDDGTLTINKSIVIFNFIVQRIFRINGDSPWPVNYTSRITFCKNIILGKGVVGSIARCGGCYLQGNGGIKIGDGTIIAPGVKIISANHDCNNFNEYSGKRGVLIGMNCWLGTNSIILPGVTLGDGVIVGAGSVVTKDFQNNVIVAGNPAKIIGEI